MSKVQRALSPYATDAVILLGQLIRKTRIQKKMATADVAIRSGVSRGLLNRIERGDPGCAIGAVFEVATIVGVHLFEAGQSTMALTLGSSREVMQLLPRSVRRQRKEVDDDF